LLAHSQNKHRGSADALAAAVEGSSSTMTLESGLTEELLSNYPSRAAVVLERLGLAPAVAFLAKTSPNHLARVAPLLSPQFAGAVLGTLPIEKLAAMLAELPPGVASRLARQLGDRVDAVIDLLPAEARESLRSLLRFPSESAGGLMDPRVLALPDDLTAGEALDRVRELPENARYNLYVVDRDHVLTGVLNLRELFLARPAMHLRDLMIPNPFFLEAAAARSVIVSHPGWREAHSIPVVDESHRYLGAVRYRTLRGLEDALGSRDQRNTADALGELLAVGAGSFVRALTANGTGEHG
jgi:magnesium transporter